MLEDAPHLVVGEEALADVVELEDRERDAHVQLLGEHGQLEHAAKGGNLVVDGTPGGTVAQPRRDVARDVAVGDRHRGHAGEGGAEMLDRVLDPVPCPVLLLQVVGADQLDQVVECHLLGVRSGQAPARHLGLPHAQQPHGHRAHR